MSSAASSVTLQLGYCEGTAAVSSAAGAAFDGATAGTCIAYLEYDDDAEEDDDASSRPSHTLGCRQSYSASYAARGETRFTMHISSMWAVGGTAVGCGCDNDDGAGVSCDTKRVSGAQLLVPIAEGDADAAPRRSSLNAAPCGCSKSSIVMPLHAIRALVCIALLV